MDSPHPSSPRFTTPYATMFASALFVLQGLRDVDGSDTTTDAQLRELTDLARITIGWFGVDPLLDNPAFAHDPDAAARAAEASVAAAFARTASQSSSNEEAAQRIATGIALSGPERAHRMEAYGVAFAVVRATTWHTVSLLDTDEAAPKLRSQPGTALQHELRLILREALELTSSDVSKTERAVERGWPSILEVAEAMRGPH